MKSTILKIQKIIFLSLFAMALNSCSDDGKDGAPGPAGTANVIYSEWMSFPATHTQVTYDNNSSYMFSFPTPDLTQEVIDHGTVMTYIKVGDGPVSTLPYTLGSNYIIRPLLQPEELQILTYQIGGASGFVLNANAKIRYVIIPGGTAASAPSAKTSLDYTKMSYEQVCSMLNIPM